MKTFHCTACQSLVFFENSRCLTCGHTLAFAADQMTMLSLNPQDDGTFRADFNGVNGTDGYRLCANYVQHGVCNWSIRGDCDDTLCIACALSHTIPDLDVTGNLEAWAKLETAKRRLLFDMMSLELPLIGKRDAPVQGLEFRFLSDTIAINGDRGRVLTGHDNGLITINVAEADDVHREAQRLLHREPYRTLLGHFRHEIGHYYWDRLIDGSDRLAAFRELFGDDRDDYQAALKAHYEQGAPVDWPDRFISAYASTHPWEDWAESWAHVMHMVDALETAHAVGLSVRPARDDEPALAIPAKASNARIGDFDQLIAEWKVLTYVLNNLTRGLGLADAYPFVLSDRVVEKLRFVCSAMSQSSGGRAMIETDRAAA